MRSMDISLTATFTNHHTTPHTKYTNKRAKCDYIRIISKPDREQEVYKTTRGLDCTTRAAPKTIANLNAAIITSPPAPQCTSMK